MVGQKWFLPMSHMFCIGLFRENMLKETVTLIITMFDMKDLNKPWILIPVSSKSVEKCGSCGRLNMDCNGGGHIVGLVTSLSLIKYA